MKLKQYYLNLTNSVYKILSQSFGIIIISTSLVLCVFSDVFRGAVLGYSLFLGMGLGLAVWMVSPKNNLSVAISFAPVIGFSIIAILGSWLVVLDYPVKVWAGWLTVVLIVLNGVLLILWVKHRSGQISSINWKNITHEIGLGYGAIILVILPVVIGGLKFSALRGNPDDANNYMAMAAYLADIPYSLQNNAAFLFQKNPAVLVGASLLYSRWTTSMLLAYAAQIVNVPLYRFDFAFSVLPFTFSLAPIFIILRETKIKRKLAFLLSVGIAAGYYAQVILDSRAVSFSTSFPVLIVFVFLIARIWDDDQIYARTLPAHPGEIVLLVLLLMAMFLLYTEIFAFLGLGVILGGIYFILKNNFQVKKVITLMLSGLAGLGIIYITLPLYIRFFWGQLSWAQNASPHWENAFFSWIYQDFPAGSWGLNPYQVTHFVSMILYFFALLMFALLLIGFAVIIFSKTDLETVFHLSIFLVIGGFGIFTYFYLRGQLWQAGKFITYLSPFLMISISAIPPALVQKKGLKSYPFIPIAAYFIVSLWLILQAGLGIQRFIVVSFDYNYPYYVRGAYSSPYKTYNWNITPFLAQLDKESNPSVWLSSNTVYQDDYWAFALPAQMRVFNIHPTARYLNTMDLSLDMLTKNSPDYILLSNQVWDLNSADAQITPVVRDDAYSLIKLSRRLPAVPLLIGIRNNPYSFSINPKADFWFSQEPAWLEFLSPVNCVVDLSTKVQIEPKQNTSLKIVVTSNPAAVEKTFSIDQMGDTHISIPLVTGYNFVALEVDKSLLKGNALSSLWVGLKQLKFDYSDCSIR